MVAAEDVLREHSYLVARGVRCLALAGHLHVEQRDELLRVSTQVERAAGEGTLPFVLDHGNGTASYGYASGLWALDLYEWAVSSPLVPEEQRDRIIGLLLGYSGPSIARYEEEGSGRRFTIAAVRSQQLEELEARQNELHLAMHEVESMPASEAQTACIVKLGERMRRLVELRGKSEVGRSLDA